MTLTGPGGNLGRIDWQPAGASRPPQRARPSACGCGRELQAAEHGPDQTEATAGLKAIAAVSHDPRTPLASIKVSRSGRLIVLQTPCSRPPPCRPPLCPPTGGGQSGSELARVCLQVPQGCSGWRASRISGRPLDEDPGRECASGGPAQDGVWDARRTARSTAGAVLESDVSEPRHLCRAVLYGGAPKPSRLPHRGAPLAPTWNPPSGAGPGDAPRGCRSAYQSRCTHRIRARHTAAECRVAFPTTPIPVRSPGRAAAGVGTRTSMGWSRPSTATVTMASWP